MGVLNVTADSFSDGGRHLAFDDAVSHARRMVAEGADLIDIGGESTRPGALRVEESDEEQRVVPLVREVSGFAPVSVDTMRSRVAARAMEEGCLLYTSPSPRDS